MGDFFNIDTIIDIMAGYNTYPQRKVERTVNGDYTIDTAYTTDCGFETAIWKYENDMIVVERYPDKNAAIIGHEKWVRFTDSEPKTAYSVQFDLEMEFEEEEEND